jgi:hypothetical protein
MARYLIPFTDPGSAKRIVRRLIAGPRTAADEVVLLAIVEPLTPGRVSIYLTRSRAVALATAAATQWSAELERMLAEAGISCRSEVAVGRATDILATTAARTDVDSVLLPPSPSEWLTRRWTDRRATRLARGAGHHVGIAR